MTKIQTFPKFICIFLPWHIMQILSCHLHMTRISDLILLQVPSNADIKLKRESMYVLCGLWAALSLFDWYILHVNSTLYQISLLEWLWYGVGMVNILSIVRKPKWVQTWVLTTNQAVILSWRETVFCWAITAQNIRQNSSEKASEWGKILLKLTLYISGSRQDLSAINLAWWCYVLLLGDLQRFFVVQQVPGEGPGIHLCTGGRAGRTSQARAPNTNVSWISANNPTWNYCAALLYFQQCALLAIERQLQR